MQRLQLEAWALEVIERMVARQPAESDYVELKSTWPEPTRVARRLAGHANAARGEPILWLIGVDEAGSVPGVSSAELANWWGTIEAQFDGLAPELSHLNVPYKGPTVAALLFETTRAPFVVNNAAGGHIQREVPWREGTKVRSATRADLVRMLAPLQRLPRVEVMQGQIKAWVPKGNQGPPTLTWTLDMDAYVEPMSERWLVIPFHRCRASFECTGLRFDFARISLNHPTRWVRGAGFPTPTESASVTIATTNDEAVIQGPGRLLVRGRLEGMMFHEAAPIGDATVTVELQPTDIDRPAVLRSVLPPGPKEGDNIWAAWQTEDYGRW